MICGQNLFYDALQKVRQLENLIFLLYPTHTCETILSGCLSFRKRQKSQHAKTQLAEVNLEDTNNPGSAYDELQSEANLCEKLESPPRTTRFDQGYLNPVFTGGSHVSSGNQSMELDAMQPPGVDI